MNIQIEQITNGILVSAPIGENGRYEKVAFTGDVNTYIDDAKAHIDLIKSDVAELSATRAKERIDQLTSNPNE